MRSSVEPKVLLVLLALAKLSALGTDLLGRLPQVLPPPKYRKSTSRDLWTAAEMRYFVQELSPLGLDLEALLLVIYAESGCDPHARNGQYVGLMQTGNELRAAVKYPGSADDYAALDVVGQCPWLRKVLAVQLSRLGRLPANVQELWAMNLAPARLKSGAAVLYNRDRDAAAYKGNAALDLEKDGDITIDDLHGVLIKLSMHTFFLNQRDVLRDAIREMQP